MEFTTPFFREFAESYSERSGPRLAKTLRPDISTDKLRKICKSHNAHDIKSSLKRGLQLNAALADGLDQQEVQGWVDVYVAYWNGAKAILAARESSGDGQVSTGAVAGLAARAAEWMLIEDVVIGARVDQGLRRLD